MRDLRIRQGLVLLFGLVVIIVEIVLLLRS